jgi:hypothetical protein
VCKKESHDLSLNGATKLCTSTKECNKLNLTATQYSDWSIIMIGPGGLLLVVPMYMQFQLQFIDGVPKKNTAKLRHLILSSTVTD